MRDYVKSFVNLALFTVSSLTVVFLATVWAKLAWAIINLAWNLW